MLKVKHGAITLDSQHLCKTVVITRSPNLLMWLIVKTTDKFLSKPSDLPSAVSK